MADISNATRSLANLEDISQGLDDIRRTVASGNDINERVAVALEELIRLAKIVNPRPGDPTPAE